MGPYAYAITINRTKQVVKIPFAKTLDDQKSLTIGKLEKLAQGHPFDIDKNDFNEYVITVHATRLETDKELAARVAKEVAYMDEYTKRKNNSGKA